MNHYLSAMNNLIDQISDVEEPKVPPIYRDTHNVDKVYKEQIRFKKDILGSGFSGNSRMLTSLLLDHLQEKTYVSLWNPEKMLEEVFASRLYYAEKDKLNIFLTLDWMIHMVFDRESIRQWAFLKIYENHNPYSFQNPIQEETEQLDYFTGLDVKRDRRGNWIVKMPDGSWTWMNYCRLSYIRVYVEKRLYQKLKIMYKQALVEMQDLNLFENRPIPQE